MRELMNEVIGSFYKNWAFTKQFSNLKIESI